MSLTPSKSSDADVDESSTIVWVVRCKCATGIIDDGLEEYSLHIYT